MEIRTLDKLALLYGTDKSSELHNYCVKYEKYFPFDRSDNLKILEIGVEKGSSLKMWRDYFFNSEIIGIDFIKECKKYEEDRIKIEIGNQTDEKFLNEIIKKYKNFDLIIDDGSHNNNDVIKSFEILFPFIKSQGIYIIEDSCTSYWTEFNGGYKKEGSSIEYFKNFIDHVNFFGIKNFDFYGRNARKESALFDLSQKEQPNCRIDIESINFLNSLIIITKR